MTEWGIEKGVWGILINCRRGLMKLVIVFISNWQSLIYCMAVVQKVRRGCLKDSQLAVTMSVGFSPTNRLISPFDLIANNEYWISRNAFELPTLLLAASVWNCAIVRIELKQAELANSSPFWTKSNTQSNEMAIERQTFHERNSSSKLECKCHVSVQLYQSHRMCHAWDVHQSLQSWSLMRRREKQVSFSFAAFWLR